MPITNDFNVGTAPTNDSYESLRDAPLTNWPFSTNANVPFRVDQGPSGPLKKIPTDETILTDGTIGGYKVRKILLDTHNYYRKVDAPDASYMNKLLWDFSLEAYAFEYATYLCQVPNWQFQHSPQSGGSPQWPFRTTQGENLYGKSASISRSQAEKEAQVIVTKWYNEKEYYDIRTGSSKIPGKPIGHYTQIVRQEATAVGCAFVTDCHGTYMSQGSNQTAKTLLVCQYDYGNVGMIPYKPNNGRGTCHSCPKGLNCCEQGLCSGAATTDTLEPFEKPKYYSDEWYGCSNWQRSSCAGTGATGMTAFASDLEFNRCNCGDYNLTGYSTLFDITYHGFLWWRNRCFQFTNSLHSRALSHVPYESAEEEEEIVIEVNADDYDSSSDSEIPVSMFYGDVFEDEETNRRPLLLTEIQSEILSLNNTTTLSINDDDNEDNEDVSNKEDTEEDKIDTLEEFEMVSVEVEEKLVSEQDDLNEMKTSETEQETGNEYKAPSNASSYAPVTSLDHFVEVPRRALEISLEDGDHALGLDAANSLMERLTTKLIMKKLPNILDGDYLQKNLENLETRMKHDEE